AASKYGDSALNIASITKMLRVLWIIPISLGLVLGFAQNRESFKIPTFIIGFVAASCIYSGLPEYQNLYRFFYLASKQAMVLSLFFIGASISIENIKNVGKSVVLQAVGLWLIICLLSLYYVIHFQS
ncbi:MAG: putative sulfate exporter family transporter, partial [Emticicia sp.]|nr:putative sulfate exporter family transporter [Emticicia sp.]